MIVILTLLFSNILVFMLTTTGALSLSELGIIPSLVSGGEFYRLLTSIFAHAGFIHLLSNMAALAYCGKELESEIGHMKMLAAYLLCGLSGSVSVLLFSGPYTMTVGASGAIFGLMGILFVRMIKTGDRKGFAVIGQNIAVNVYITFTNPEISASAHFGGLACGLIIGFLMSTKDASAEPDEVEATINEPSNLQSKKDESEGHSPMILIVLGILLLIGAGLVSSISKGDLRNGSIPSIRNNQNFESVMKVSPNRTLITK